MKRILYISPNFNLACGVSKHVYTLLTSEKLNSEFDLFFITNGGDALFKLDLAGINYSIESFKTNSVFHFDLFNNLKWVKQYCAEKQIDIIHSHHRYPELLSNLVKKSLGIKTVVTVHNFVSGFKKFSYKSNRIIAINYAVKEHLLTTFRTDTKKIEVLYNCIRNEENSEYNGAKIKRSLDIPEGSAVILFLGRIIKEKGIYLLLKAHKLLLESNRNVILTIAGSGDISIDAVKDVELKRIKIFPPTDNVKQLYAIANVVVLPSQREPFGYTMLEAGLYKIPFVGSRAGGISEFIEDRVNGYLFQPDNVNDLTEKIKFVLDNPLVARNSALKLNEKVVRNCNCNDYFQKLTDIYQKLLAD